MPMLHHVMGPAKSFEILDRMVSAVGKMTNVMRLHPAARAATFPVAVDERALTAVALCKFVPCRGRNVAAD